LWRIFWGVEKEERKKSTMKFHQKNPIPLPEVGATSSIKSTIETVFDWEYDLKRKNLLNLYEKGKALNWNATELPWETDVDIEKIQKTRMKNGAGDMMRATLIPPKPVDDEFLMTLGIEQNAFMLSQFLHGEQGALVATAKLVQACPDEEAKFYAASQVLDEARHVEVYHRYLTEKLGTSYPILPSLGNLLDDVIEAKDWDMSFLGMQIMVEGIALGAFAFVKLSNPDEPLILEITERVMQDESRHVAFGVLTLEDMYKDGLSENEMREREDFVLEASHVLKERLNSDQVLERLGINTPDWLEWQRNSPYLRGITSMVFSKVVPNLKRIGLLTPRVRKAYEQMNLIHFEHGKDSLEDVTVEIPDELVKSLTTMIGENTHAK